MGMSTFSKPAVRTAPRTCRNNSAVALLSVSMLTLVFGLRILASRNFSLSSGSVTS